MTVPGTGCVMDGPVPLLVAETIINYLSWNSSVVSRSGLILVGFE